jgi:hypothetical protein
MGRIYFLGKVLENKNVKKICKQCGRIQIYFQIPLQLAAKESKLNNYAKDPDTFNYK